MEMMAGGGGRLASLVSVFSKYEARPLSPAPAASRLSLCEMWFMYTRCMSVDRKYGRVVGEVQELCSSFCQWNVPTCL